MNRFKLQQKFKMFEGNMTIQEMIVSEISGKGLPNLPPIQNPFVNVLPINTFEEFLWANLFVGLVYYLTYFIFGGLLEFTNPIPKTEYRRQNTKKQIILGFSALFVVIVYTTLWYWKVEPNLPYYGYWAGRENEFTLFEAVKQTLMYMLFFDFWFYATHHLLHLPWLMKHIHCYHHQFYEPTAFAQDAVHPFEAILQGPMGHFFLSIFYPMNPLLISVLGYMTSVYALLAHDGRLLDLNDHQKHHQYRDCNFGLYWPLLDYVFGTRYNKTRFPTDYVFSYKVKAE